MAHTNTLCLCVMVVVVLCNNVFIRVCGSLGLFLTTLCVKAHRGRVKSYKFRSVLRLVNFSLCLVLSCQDGSWCFTLICVVQMAFAPVVQETQCKHVLKLWDARDENGCIYLRTELCATDLTRCLAASHPSVTWNLGHASGWNKVFEVLKQNHTHKCDGKGDKPLAARRVVVTILLCGAFLGWCPSSQILSACLCGDVNHCVSHRTVCCLLTNPVDP